MYTLVGESFTLRSMKNVALLQAFQAKTASLEELLIHLCKWGKPRLARMSKGWYCVLEVFVTPAGVSFDVKTEFDHKTPHDAACQCYDRLLKAIEEFTA